MSACLQLGELQPIATPWETGDRIDNYVLRAQIGRGGMSTVWDAWDTDLRRAVALKTMLDADDRDALLVNEARALAGVRHPGLPAVYGLRRNDRGRYLVFERLYGENLLQRLQHRGPRVELAEALQILTQLADILHAVHQAGMVHHDVKPANIMLCGERTVLLDFGVMLPQVRAASAARSGTPGYVAPEVMLDTLSPGRARLVDMYAFGVIAYELFAGAPPFGGENLMALMTNHAFQPAPDLRAVRPDLAPSLGALVAACLAKNPDDRPGDMDDIAGELRQLRRRIERRVTNGPCATSSRSRSS